MSTTTIQTRKIEVEMPENVVKTLEDMAFASDEPIQEMLRRMIYSSMECELDDEKTFATYVRKKYGYDYTAYRRGGD